MLERIDIDKVFSAARSRGYTIAEIYAETSYRSTVDIHAVSIRGRIIGHHEGKIEDVRLTTTGGIALRLSDGRMTRQLATNTISTRALLQLLGDAAADSAPREAALQPEEFPFGGMQEKVRALGHVSRAVLGMEGDGVKLPRFQYRDTVKYFEVVTSSGLTTQGREEAVEAAALWALEKDGKLHHFRHETFADQIEKTLSDFTKRNPFQRRIENSIGLLSPWPAPQGNIPVLWSPRALSKLVLQFLRGFEGDLVLGNLSFLTELALPLSLPFSVYDTPDTGRLPCDNEGSPRRKVAVFQEGRPKALACNNSVAEELQVPSTGHCRRESLYAAPTVGFWNPVLHAPQASGDLLLGMDWGISVRDLDVVRFHPTSGDIELKLTEALLVHHGEEGEWIAPVTISVNLLDLLQGLQQFGEHSETTGLQCAKRQQKFITEVSTPAAMSEPLPIPGDVPLNNYW